MNKNLLFFILLVNIVSCKEKGSNKTIITKIQQVNNEYLVKGETDLFLIKAYYTNSENYDFVNLPLDDFSTDEIFYLIETKIGRLLRKEFIEKQSKKCVLIENYDTGLNGFVEYTSFYNKGKQEIKSVEYSKAGKSYFKQDYDIDGKVTSLELDYYLETKYKSNDSVCVTITQPGAKYLGCTVDFYGKIDLTEDDHILQVSRITRDSILGIGEVCFENLLNRDTLYFNCIQYLNFEEPKKRGILEKLFPLAPPLK